MKNLKTYMLALTVVLGIGLSSCDAVRNTNNTQRGVAVGAASGAVIGGVLGNNVGKGGNTAMGAIIGGAVGGTVGGVIGNRMDKQKQKIDEVLPGADVERVGEGIKLTLNENAVRFDTNKSTLTAAARQNLDKLVAVFNEYPDTDIQIYGYTDNTGRVEYNLKLSEERAQSVRSYLVSKGLSTGRFNTIGRGIEDPIATNDTPEGRSQNRRVEFAITANEKMIQDAEREVKQ